MKISTLFISLQFVLAFVILIPPPIKSQSDFSIGAYAGTGYISGNSPNQTSLNTSVFIQMKTIFREIFSTRLSFFYDRDIDYYLGNSKNYYPFIKGLSLKGITNQDLANSLFVEEGFGLLYINDRVFSGKSSDDFGTVFSLTGGTDLRGYTNLNVKLGLGIEYGLTFNNTLADYLSIHLQGEFMF
jgi:hypothetical protein